VLVIVGKMRGTTTRSSIRVWLILLLAINMRGVPLVGAACPTERRPGWQHRNVKWRITGGNSAKVIHYPETKPVPFLDSKAGHRTRLHKKTVMRQPTFQLATPEEGLDQEKTSGAADELSRSVLAFAIDSPPIDGFVPWVVVSVTDKRLGELELDAVLQTSVVGHYPSGVNSQTDYVIGILDTGASAHVMGYANATQAGLFKGFSNLMTSNTGIISGVVGSVEAWISQPLAIFIDGLGSLDPNGLLLDTSQMVGQSNVAIVVGQDPGSRPDLTTAIGTPLSIFFTTVINNDQEVTVSRGSEEFTSPDIRLYEHEDPCIPSYSNVVPLELRPGGAMGVQYIPSYESFFEFPPMSPSVIIDNLSMAQSLMFVHSVDLAEGEYSALDKDRFMLDTGAQVTVIGSRIAARLKLNPDEPEFEVEIEDVTGQIVMTPGFYIDSIQIPAIGEWLSYTNIPVILLDVFSPEGGTVDGIIGMNLFVDFNLVLRGGGIFLEDDPALYFAPVPAIIADIAPDDSDDKVDYLDLSAFNKAWLADSKFPNWNERADMAPCPNPDGIINFLDFAVFAQYWLADIR
jgi:predicted aspartyl protease